MEALIDTVLLKVASRCNINCSYCYVYHMGDDNWARQGKFTTHETISATARELKKVADLQGKPFSIVLHGGEPFLLGVERLKFLLATLRNSLSYEFPISIQTNGVLITPELLDICSRFRASVAVSIDGPKAVHDQWRIGHTGSGTFDEVIKGYQLLKGHPDHLFLNAGLLAVVDPFSDPAEVYYFFKSLGAPSVDFLYKDGNHDRLPFGKRSLYSTEYGNWMAQLLQVYLADREPMPIRVLDDMLKVLLGGIVSKEGLGITDFGILIIDTDGTLTKNDTLKSAFNGADQFGQPVNIKDGELSAFLYSKDFEEYRRMQRPSNAQCLKCPYLDLCGGGMILHRWKKETGFNNTSVYCADQMLLIDEMKAALAKLYGNVA
ncbi:cyclophane-forming radical SAM/SPASM peptide maturase YhhB [Mucilaginibacter kameinonensis]|uniref:cyclophane-forming radical SAM/SPASM peptide maturase YhhB n=1 Tax=Mucilaginibacter kameinonensis TaxID=452286 RepID=UPI000EF844AB|nr:cyclophane-forming radical SAM/SPASM peptide maturase YhhB [Mucilaginibacter kameinonensis]